MAGRAGDIQRSAMQFDQRFGDGKPQPGALEPPRQRAIELLQERRTALISAAVTGKIDVRSLAETEAA